MSSLKFEDHALILFQYFFSGCQIILRKDLNGMVVRLPMATRNMRVDQK